MRAVIAELLARNPLSAAQVQNAPRDAKVYGTTAEEAAAIGYIKWIEFAGQNLQHGFHSHALHGDFDEASGMYKDWYVEPLFDYLDETLDDANVVLAMLIRYKQKVEWYRRTEVLRLCEGDTSRGEKNVKQHMFEFLFDQGLSFHVEPVAQKRFLGTIIFGVSGDTPVRYVLTAMVARQPAPQASAAARQAQQQPELPSPQP